MSSSKGRLMEIVIDTEQIRGCINPSDMRTRMTEQERAGTYRGAGRI